MYAHQQTHKIKGPDASQKRQGPQRPDSQVAQTGDEIDEGDEDVAGSTHLRPSNPLDT